MNIDAKKKLAEKILDYWYIMEFLGQDRIPGLTQDENRKNREALKKKDAKALKILVPLKKDEKILKAVFDETQKYGMNLCGNITFYVGKMERETCIQKLTFLLGEKENRPEGSYDDIAWFSFQLDCKGFYIEDSFSLSTIIWAINHINTAGKNALMEQFDEKIYRAAVEDIEVLFRKAGKHSGNGAPKEICSHKVYDIYRYIDEKYIRNFFDTEERKFFCLLQFQIFKDEKSQEKYLDDNYLGLNMDFYSDDLKMVLQKLHTGMIDERNAMQKAMIDYIVSAYSENYPDRSVLNTMNRVDLGITRDGSDTAVKLRELFSIILDVGNAPIGKWPSRFMPALMQQTAINLFNSRADGTVIFSVNGPPGTGKTTLLKEIVANNVVERAALLAEYNQPDNAFEVCSFKYGEKANNGYSKYYSQYYKLKNERINDYSILVTSNNNDAVQNITTELPTEGGILGALGCLDTDSEQMGIQLKEVQDLFTVGKSCDTQTLYCKDVKKNGVYRDIYFSAYAKELLNGEEAWGLISVPLGKKSNIRRFYYNVLKPLDEDYYKNDIIAQRPYRKVRDRFLRQKKKVDRMAIELENYCAAERMLRDGCAQLEKEIIRLKSIRQESDAIAEQKRQEAGSMQKEVERIQSRLQMKEDEIQISRKAVEECEKEVLDADRDYEENLTKARNERSGIGLLMKIFRRSEARVKNELADKYEADAKRKKDSMDLLRKNLQVYKSSYEEGQNELSVIEKEKVELVKEYTNVEQEILTRKRESLEFEANIEACSSAISRKKNNYMLLIKQAEDETDVNFSVFLSSEFIEDLLSNNEEDNTKSQVSNLWFTNYYNREREKLFYAALKLNKEFVLASKCCFRNFRNLALLWHQRLEDEDKKMVSFHPEDRKACFGILLQSLFLLVPVVSTTFASVGKFLKDIDQPGIIGNLIIDEAGQAPPQMAVGALYRSRRAIIVGDPRQVEPVVTEDLRLLKKVYREDVYKPYKAKNVSVQKFADTINPYGTYLENEANEKEWVGCPLIVHRRCISPMYEISNLISYNNTMKQQTRMPNEKKVGKFCYSGSRWMNVIGKELGQKNHYVEEQGKRVLQILEIAFMKQDSPSLFVITPFTTVKNGMLHCIEQSLRNDKNSVLYKKRESVKAWMYKYIGTVHTFQGKEADEVVFLLGCDSSQQAQGAVKWVGSNIVNVAVTRAKYRLYIIGDEKAWKNSQYLRQAKSLIDTYALKELSFAANREEEDFGQRKENALMFCDQVPSAESFSIELTTDEAGNPDCVFDVETYLKELQGSEILLNDITDKQLEGYGFSRESFNRLDVQVKNYVEWGIKLYSMIKSLYSNFPIQEMDVSCCGILFCKAIEIQLKLCIYKGLKEHFPNARVYYGTLLKDAKIEHMTIGNFVAILKKEENIAVLAADMMRHDIMEYNASWWRMYAQELFECKELRNSCCHCNKFTWKQINNLLVNLFLKKKSQNQKAMEGSMRDSEVAQLFVELSNT